MNAIVAQETPSENPQPDVEELPVQQPNEFEDVPLPRKVTRETDAEKDKTHEKEDLRHGDEGIDDPPPESDEMGD